MTFLMMKKCLPSLFILCLIYLFFVSSAFASTTPKINEFVAHPSSGNEWVEFFNPDHIDLTNYYVDDDTDFSSDVGSSSKKSLATLNTTNSEFPYIELSSMLNNSGDNVVLFDGSGNILDQYNYVEDHGVDVAIGRSPDGTGAFAAMSLSTKGSANSSFLPTPTNSPTPKPSVTPTSKPSPTHSPTPTPKTSTPTPTFKPQATATPKPATKVVISTPTDEPQTIEGTNDPSKEVLADAITPTHSAVSGQAAPTTKVLSESAKPNVIAISFFVIGGILFVGCGILLFHQYRTNKKDETHI